MTEIGKLNQLVQQPILEHGPRLKHVDELIDHAQAGMTKTGGAAEQLTDVKRKRDQLSGRIEAFKLKPLDPWSKEGLEKTAPMVVWDTLVQKLEKRVDWDPERPFQGNPIKSAR